MDTKRISPVGLTLKQAAERLTICVKTLRRMIDDGRVTAVRVSERRVVISSDEIQTILNGEKEWQGK